MSNACDDYDNVNEAVRKIGIEEEERFEEEEILEEVGTPFDVLLKLCTDGDKSERDFRMVEVLGFVKCCRDTIIEL
ncbi:Hypothetical predicted protein [Olea europaea subsp. europaea]|uniref:Uncharacterized protein n=1 Tax=Olea europaea subsp. europaea TaxID=158383 RepID=A0A8S0STJ6_OLEEU|nr:Hypothetical predicted protein [Olea europaea subsp. europaea]